MVQRQTYLTSIKFSVKGVTEYPNREPLVHASDSYLPQSFNNFINIYAMNFDINVISRT